jgi:hypothetical protein
MNTAGPSQKQPSSPTGVDRNSLVDDQTRPYRSTRYHKLRQRRAKGRHRQSEAQEIFRFAQIWIPFGGAPSGEIFQTFGMSRQRFLQKLWQSVHDLECDPTCSDQLAETYPVSNAHHRDAERSDVHR